MPKTYHPSADYNFIVQKIIESNKVINKSLDRIGSTAIVICKGNSAIYKRTVIVKISSDEEVSFNQASGLAIRFNFVPDLLKWFEENKNWKEGEYIKTA